MFSDEAIRSLSSLLNPHLPFHALRYRANVLQDLFVKGYRIKFRMRMAPVRWEIEWPLVGAAFSGATIVNASRMLYVDAVSPVVRKREYVGGMERRRWCIRGLRMFRGCEEDKGHEAEAEDAGFGLMVSAC